MNKSGQTGVVFYAFMLGIVIIILGIALAPAITQSIDNVTNQTSTTNYSYEIINSSGDTEIVNGTIENIGLDCDNSTISNFDKATCVAIDYGGFYLLSGLIFIGGAVLVSRILF